MKKARANIFRNNYQYGFWFLFYMMLFAIPTFGLIIPLYIIGFFFATSNTAEGLWRIMSGVRPLRLNLEKNRLLPLFSEVYGEAVKLDKNLPKNITLYIQENIDINAFAFGKTTLVLTRGSIELLSDECLKGLIAHELGHFSNCDTIVTLFANVGNFPLSLLIKSVTKTKEKLTTASENSFTMKVFKNLFDVIYILAKIIEFLGDLIIRWKSRSNEYRADYFASKCGFNTELTSVLIEIYQVSIEKPQSVKEQLKNTHPSITLRIEMLEKLSS